MYRVNENNDLVLVGKGDTFLYKISYGNIFLLRYCGEFSLDEYYSLTTKESGPYLLNQIIISDSIYLGNFKNSILKEILLPYA